MYCMPTFWEAITLLTSKRNRDFQEVAQLISNVFPDPLFVIDLEANRFVWVSPGGISLFGLDVEESSFASCVRVSQSQFDAV
jgi:PAS domain-containing protein